MNSMEKGSRYGFGSNKMLPQKKKMNMKNTNKIDPVVTSNDAHYSSKRSFSTGKSQKNTM